MNILCLQTTEEEDMEDVEDASDDENPGVELTVVRSYFTIP